MLSHLCQESHTVDSCVKFVYTKHGYRRYYEVIEMATAAPSMELYTLKQARKILDNMSRSTFYRRVAEGQIRSVFLAGIKRRAYSKEDVDRIAQEREFFNSEHKLMED